MIVSFIFERRPPCHNGWRRNNGLVTKNLKIVSLMKTMARKSWHSAAQTGVASKSSRYVRNVEPNPTRCCNCSATKWVQTSWIMLGISNAASVKTKRSLSTKNSLTSNVRTSAGSTRTASVPPSGLTALCSWGKFRRLVTGCIFPLTDRIVFDLSDIKLSSNTYDFMMSGR